MEQKYNVIVGVAFNGEFIAYRQTSKQFCLASATQKELNDDKTLEFTNKEILELKKHVDDELISYIDKCTFKVGQASMLNNPFKK